MKKTVLITGSSRGIGKAAAEYFASKGWNVAATMRNIQDPVFSGVKGIKKITLDVHDTSTIRSAIAETVKEFGRLDAVVNNAGFAVAGPFENTKEEDMRKQFETNVFGLMRVCHEVIPHFREQGTGTIANITSVGGRITFPLYSLYHATKWAVEGFSESLQYELNPFNIRIKIIEPGPVKTEFYEGSRTNVVTSGPYSAYTDNAMKNMDKFGITGASPSQTARVIFNAVNDTSGRLRYPADMGAQAMLAGKSIFPGRWFRKIVEKVVTR